MNSLLVNTNENIINGYIYLCQDKEHNSYNDIIEENNSYDNIIEEKIAILSQDFILALPFSKLSEQKHEMELLKFNI